jgi:hypothetical protein
MKCRLLIDMTCRACPQFPEGIKVAGTIIEHEDAYRLVMMGCAEPADEECASKVPPRTPEQTAAKLDAYKKMDAGIAPEDREAWDRGWMRGYTPDGNWIPGPNADELEEYEYEEYKKTSRLVLP